MLMKLAINLAKYPTQLRRIVSNRSNYESNIEQSGYSESRDMAE